VPKLAWFEYLLGNADQSVQLLSHAAAYQKGESKALSLYYRGAILNRVGRYEEARTSLDEALAERDDLILARQEKGNRFGSSGAAMKLFRFGPTQCSAMPVWLWLTTSLPALSVCQANSRRPVRMKQQADESTPNNPLFHWMLGRRLQDLGMTELAEKTFPPGRATRRREANTEVAHACGVPATASLP